jgi:hypothetical protein
MMEKCFDIGTIQAFLDGELKSDVAQRLTRHIALCDDCAILLAEAEEETAFAFAALEREFDTLVPTQRLWTKINDSIIVEKKQSSVWQRFLTLVSVYISSPSFGVAAGVLVVIGLFAAVLSLQNGTDSNEMATVSVPPVFIEPAKVPETVYSDIETISPAPVTVTDKEVEIEQIRPRVQQAAVREDSRRSSVRNLVFKTNYREPSASKDAGVQPVNYAPAYLPGEESYVKTIADLTQTVETQKDAVLRPAARVAFERDLAVVNDTIKKMKTEVSRNPRNESAKQVLYSSYQNKIDLLNSVAEKTELMASLK